MKAMKYVFIMASVIIIIAGAIVMVIHHLKSIADNLNWMLFGDGAGMNVVRK
ncbi:MAG: hypothetical protein Q7S33_02370 [Nanoarchaeota archaeon]|nr:hypothetical protein [Nanoarchaeota archaeon]